MGTDKNEPTTHNQKARANGKAKAPTGALVNFNLTGPQKEALKNSTPNAVRALTVIGEFVEDRLAGSFGYSPKHDGHFLILKTKEDDWRNSTGVAFWGSSLERCFLLACFYLEEVNPDFPANISTPLFADDW